MRQSIKSIQKKINTIQKGGVDNLKAIKEGLNNYNNYNNDVELLACERAKICVNCTHYKEEPNNLLKVTDDLFPELDEMYCSDCGCSLPYKLRQSLIKCAKWIK